jgi:DNA-directed RNA polymerase subunit F
MLCCRDNGRRTEEEDNLKPDPHKEGVKMEIKSSRNITAAEASAFVEKEMGATPSYMDDLSVKHGKEMLPKKSSLEKVEELKKIVNEKAAVKIADVNPLTVDTLKLILQACGESADEKKMENILDIMKGK